MGNTKYASGTQQNSGSDASRNVIMHHLKSFQNNDLDAVLDDYTNESLLVTQAATFTGIKEIKGFFVELVTHFPKGKSDFELDKIVSSGDMVYIVWHAKTPSLYVPLGSDTFIVKNDKIYQQTFVGQLEFR